MAEYRNHHRTRRKNARGKRNLTARDGKRSATLPRSPDGAPAKPAGNDSARQSTGDLAARDPDVVGARREVQAPALDIAKSGTQAAQVPSTKIR